MTTTGTSTSTRTSADRGTLTGERADLLETLAKHRFFLRNTLRDLSDEQANRHTTASELTLCGLVKHVSAAEAGWARFILEGPGAMGTWDPAALAEHAADLAVQSATFQILDGETVSSLLAEYEKVARTTDELVEGLSDLDAGHLLPKAPWFEPGASWSARRALLHIIAETAQHAGHADIIRESLDGSKSMG